MIEEAMDNDFENNRRTLRSIRFTTNLENGLDLALESVPDHTQQPEQPDVENQ